MYALEECQSNISEIELLRALRGRIESSSKECYLRIIDYIRYRHLDPIYTDSNLFEEFINQLVDLFHRIDRPCPKDIPSTQWEYFINNKLSDHEFRKFILHWASIQAAKYCIHSKHESLGELMSFVDDEITKTFSLSDTPTRCLLLILIQALEKCISCQPDDPKTLTSKYGHISEKLSAWLDNIRPALAELSLIVNHPSECWRQANCQLLNTVTFTSQGQDDDVLDEPPLRDTGVGSTNISLECLDQLVASSSYLADVDTLRGIRCVLQESSIHHKRVLLATELAINNLEGRLDSACALYESETEPSDISTIEFLKACHRLDILNDHLDKIKTVKSSRFRDALLKYHEVRYSRTAVPIECDSYLNRWARSWSGLRVSEKFEENVPMKSHIDLQINIAAIETGRNNRSVLDLVEKLNSQLETTSNLFSLGGESILERWLKAFSISSFGHLRTDKANSNYILKSPDYIYQALRDTRVLEGCLLKSDVSRGHDVDEVTREFIDSARLAAAKFHLKDGRNQLGRGILPESLGEDVTGFDARSMILKIRFSHELNEHQKMKEYLSLWNRLSAAKATDIVKRSAQTRILCELLRSPLCYLYIDNCLGDTAVTEWTYQKENPRELTKGRHHTTRLLLDRWCSQSSELDIDLQCKTLQLAINRYLKSCLPNDELHGALRLSVKALVKFCQSNSNKHKSSAVDVALQILRIIRTKSHRIICTVEHELKTDTFFHATKAVWFQLRSNLVTMLTSCKHIVPSWSDVLLHLTLRMARERPQLFLYQCLVNRLDLRVQLDCLEGRSRNLSEEPAMISTHYMHDEGNDDLLDDCRHMLKFWDKIYEQLLLSDENDWLNIARQTETFIREIRRISFLPSEHLRLMLLRMHRKINELRSMFFLDEPGLSQSGVITRIADELRDLYIKEKDVFGMLLDHCDWVEENPGKTSIYDTWFLREPGAHLRTLDSMIKSEIDSIEEGSEDSEQAQEVLGRLDRGLRDCYGFILEFSRRLNEKLYMALLSPMLSKIDTIGKHILMPLDQQLGFGAHPSELLFVHRVQQKISLINSLNNPKKISLICSNGSTKSFCLKANDDSRLEWAFIELFKSLNIHLAGCKETRDWCRLRHYSMTPISNCAGLNEWLDLPSLHSIFNQWFHSPRGKRLHEKFYSDTCSALCLDGVHECQPPPHSESSSRQMFYHLLWSKTRSSGKDVAKERPNLQNIKAYYREFGASLFKEVVETMINLFPQDLIAQRLWFKSTSSFDYWKRTRRFTYSCATSSAVGYILGLGDRHPDNILLDDSSGEVIHIDMGICFGLGQGLRVPELVPFRLTPSLVRAFGFAGLEGPFAHSLFNNLKLFNQKRNTFLQHLSEDFLSYLLRSRKLKHDPLAKVTRDTSVEQPPTRLNQLKDNCFIELNLCREDQDDKFEPIEDCVCNDCRESGHAAGASGKPGEGNIHDENTDQAFDNARRVEEYIRDRLLGKMDSLLTGLKSRNTTADGVSFHSITDEYLTPAQLVSALIHCAKSTERMAAMHDGWMPWV